MSENLIIAIVNLVSRLGLDLALTVMRGLNKAATIDEVIAALEAAANKTAQDFVDEDAAARGITPKPLP